MRLFRSPTPDTSPGTQRLEAFSDGVFAIAITLLILEIRVPPLNEGSAHISLFNALLGLWPSYFAYILSFVMIGIYWANHHYLYRLFRGTDHVFNLINVFFLMSISFLPFPTAVLADFMRETDNQQTAVMFYALGLLLPAFFWFMAWLYASRGDRLLDPNLDAHFVRYLTRQFLVSNVLYLGAVIVAFFNPVAGLAVCTVLTLLYLLPPRTPVYRPDTGTFREAGDD